MEELYKKITEANQEIKTMDIKGKSYAAVAERINAFRKVFPDGQIITEIIKQSDNEITIKATIWACDKVLGVGHASEERNSSYINKTSYLENCETSAVGRALGMCGFGIQGEVASAEEAVRAIEAQEIAKEKITPAMVQSLELGFKKHDIPEEEVEDLLKRYKCKKLEDLNNSQFKEIINEYRKRFNE